MAIKPQINQPHPPLPPSPSKRRLQNRRLALSLCGLCGAAVVLLGLTILILAFTVFKVKDPQLTMNAIHIDRLFVPGLGASLANPFSLNATLTADISIRNPNAASFRFRNSTTEFYYGGEVVGVAYAPAGRVRARRTLRMNVTVDVLEDRVVVGTNETAEAAAAAALGGGGINITSFTDVSGRVDLLGVYKRDLGILLNCSFTLGVSGNSFLDRVCQANVL